MNVAIVLVHRVAEMCGDLLGEITVPAKPPVLTNKAWRLVGLGESLDQLHSCLFDF